MKHLPLAAVLASPLVLAGPLAQEAGDDDLAAELAAQTTRIDDLERDLVEARDTLDLVLVRLQAQADAAEDLEASLARSEELGFTAGINPRSREVLLAGWRGYLDEQQVALPKAKPAAE